MLAQAWQHPFVSIFKLCEVEEWKHVSKAGNVVNVLDKVIGKRVFSISGSVPAANYVQLPKTKGPILGLTGQFLYLQIQVKPQKDWALHIDAVDVSDKVHRISLSNIYKPGSDRVTAMGQQVYMGHVSPKWTVIALDMTAMLMAESHTPYKAVSRVQFCANMRVRGAFTSHLKYSLASLPREMQLNPALDDSQYDCIWLPVEPPGQPDTDDDHAKVSSDALPLVKVGKSGRPPVWEGQPYAAIELPAEVARSHSTSPAKDYSRAYPDRAPSPPAPPSPTPPSCLDAGPCLELESISGFTGEYTNSLTWSVSNRLFFVASRSIVSMDPKTLQQCFFHGHTDHVAAFAFSGDGLTMASAQGGKQAMIRIWDVPSGKCLAVLCHHASGMTALDVSEDGCSLVAVGLDSFSKQLIVVWDISNVRKIKKCPVIVKSTTEHNIKRVKFCAYEPEKFMSAGRDSVRLYRTKCGVLRGLSIQVSEARRKLMSLNKGHTPCVGLDIFTDIAFEQGQAAMALGQESRVFVASVSGSVYQINYDKLHLETVYQLHTGAINTLVVNEGFAITGSDDKYLRVWPIDFSDFFLEAEHETPVTAVGMSPDGLQLCVGTENGSIGLLDIATHKYSTVLRSHTDSVNALAVDGSGKHLVTASSDSTIRIWNLATHQQLYEFEAPGEAVLCVQCHPLQEDVACGFSTGVVRIFHVPTTSLIKEFKLHRSGVKQIMFSPDGERLLSLGRDGYIHVHDVLQVYMPSKVLALAPANVQSATMAMSADGTLLAASVRIAGQTFSSILLYSGPQSKASLKIETEAPAFDSLAFTPDGHLWAATSDHKLEKYCCTSGKLLAIVNALHRDTIQTLTAHPTAPFLLTGGFDCLLKIWDISKSETAPKGKTGTPHQTFVGHSGAVLAAVQTGDTLVTADASDCILFWRCKSVIPSITPCAQDSMVENVSVNLPRTTSNHHHDLVEQAVPPHAELEAPEEPRSSRIIPEPSATGLVAADVGNPAVPYMSMPSAPAVTATTSRATAPRPACDRVIAMAHTDSSTSAWLPAQGLLLYAVDNAVVVDDLRSRRQKLLVHNQQTITALAVVGGKSAIIASASRKGTQRDSATAAICVWDIALALSCTVLAYHPTAVQAMAFSKEGAWLVSVGRAPERSVVLWDVATGSAVAVGRTEQPSVGLAWRCGASMPEFVTVGEGGAMQWKLEPTHLSQHPLGLPAGMALGGCCAVACTPGGGDFLGDHDGGVWHIGTSPGAGACHQRIIHMPESKIQGIAAIDNTVVLTTTSNSVHVFQHTEGGWMQQDKVEVDAPVLAATFSDDLVEGVVATRAATLWHVDLQARRCTPLISGHPDTIRAFATCANDPTAVATTCQDGLVRVWQMSASDAAPGMEFELPVPGSACVFSPSGAGLAAGCVDGSLRMFDLMGARVLWTADRHAVPVVAVMIVQMQSTAAADGTGGGMSTCIATAARDGAVAVSDLNTGDLVAHSPDLKTCLQGQPLDAMVASPGNGCLLAAAWGGGCSVCTTPGPQQELCVVARYTAPCPEYPVEEAPACVAFVPSSPVTVLYTCPKLQGQVIVFDHRTSSVMHTIDLTQSICSLSVRPDGRMIAAGGVDGTVFLVDQQSVSWTELHGHCGPVHASTFGACGTYLLSGSHSTMMQWNRM